MTQPITARFQLDYGNFTLDVDLQLPGTGITVATGIASGIVPAVAGLRLKATEALRSV